MIHSVMIKPVGDLCNLRCTYCYYRGASPRGAGPTTLGLERVDKLLSGWLARGPQQISISFQGGEPTLAGLEWFKGFFDIVDRHRQADQRVSFGLQTNGLQFNGDWTDLLKSRNVLVGLSMDGPEDLHDHYRIDAGGQGTFQKVQHAAELLLAEDVAVNAIVLLNDRNVVDAGGLYEFFKTRGFDWLQFIPCVEWDEKGMLRPFCVTGQTFGKFLTDLFNAWYPQDVGKMFIRYFESLVVKLAGRGGNVCYTESYCDPGLTIEHDGSVYGCDHFVCDRWRVGLMEDSQLPDWDTHPLYMGFGKQKAKLPRECAVCSHLSLCGGGCQKHRPRPGGKNILCSAYKQFLDLNLSRLERLVRQVSAR